MTVQHLDHWLAPHDTQQQYSCHHGDANAYGTHVGKQLSH